MSAATPAPPEPAKAPPTRPWVKGCGIALMIAMWSPVIALVAVPAWLWMHSARTERTARVARDAVRPGASIGEAIAASESAGRSLECYQALCAAPTESLLARRSPGGLGLQADAGIRHVPEPPQEWPRVLRSLDGVACQRLRIVFCGRPWITFQVELDAAGRVREVGPLSVTSD